ncbi:hypothetical protein HHK36_025983 [Tetracentron sinense]|uniref:non-specific serine/threonine protein kinase n=1 Tax=Tetracentron sinense TaxID=13715 RepID=A0A834YJU4_TETSI|nr:hypothetical protein HHK36_025983 [Tetracentron sinense]
MAFKLFLLFFSISFATLSFSFEPPNEEVEALISIRGSLNDPHGVLNNWDEDSADPCSWAMITCSPENLVIGLGAPSQSLSGNLSGRIGNLTNLRQMRLNNNSLSGAFPVSLAKIPQLAFLDFSYNNLSGPVPKFPARTFKKIQEQEISRCSRDKQEEGLIRLGNLRQFSLRELQVATENFSSKNILGKGGFGNVYKGRLGDGLVVAVKRLKDVSGIAGESQFKTEVEMISLAVHRNLLRLLGYCATSNERLLIYPYMSNGSVASRLRGKPPLDWNTRKRIAIGTARGLVYLHEQCDPKIIHRDVKAANVLLDDYCEAIVGDFGLAKLLDHGDSHVTTAVRGTVGHIAPEYLSTGQSSEKTDVFGFGILLLELITGMKALEFGKSANQKGAMLDSVKKIQREKRVEEIVDRDIGSSYDRIEVGEMVQVALLCTQYLPAHRPKMSEVLRMLEGDGLAEKWAASQTHATTTTSCSNLKTIPSDTCYTRTTNSHTSISKHGHGAGDDDVHSSMLVVMIDDYDDHSFDGHAMELSGPR